MAAEQTRTPAPRVPVAPASPPMAVEGVLVEEFRPFDRQPGVSAVRNTTRTAFGPTVTHTEPETGYPRTFVAGSGSGPTDRYLMTPRTVPQTQHVFYGSGLNDSHFRAIGIGHKRLEHPAAAKINVNDPAAEDQGVVREYVKRKLWEVKGQLGQRTGVAGMSIDNTQRFADSIEVVADYTPSTARISTNETDGIATLSYDRMGCERIEIQIVNGFTGSISGASATTSMNVLAAAL